MTKSHNHTGFEHPDNVHKEVVHDQARGAHTHHIPTKVHHEHHQVVPGTGATNNEGKDDGAWPGDE